MTGAKLTTAGYLTEKAKAMNEKQLQQGVVNICRSLGILCYHTHDSRRSSPGFPDCVIAHPQGPVFAELKREKARPTKDQVIWLDYLACQGFRVYIWRPTHLLNGTIGMILSREPTLGIGDGRWGIDARCVPGDRWSTVAASRTAG